MALKMVTLQSVTIWHHWTWKG